MSIQQLSTLWASTMTQSALTTIQETGANVICYSPYGLAHAKGDPSIRPAFNGQYLEPLTGLYALGNGYRTFSPVLMRFNSPDAFSPFGAGGFNSYCYVENDPVNKIDPSGRWSISRLLARWNSRSADFYDKTYKGVRTNSVSLTNSRSLGGSLMAYDSTYHGKPSLVIHGHGKPKFILGPDDAWLDADGLWSAIKNSGIAPGKYEHIRIVSCYSAASGENSLASGLSKLTSPNVKIKGYETKVHRRGSPIEKYAEDLRKIAATNISLSQARLKDRMMHIRKFSKKDLHAFAADPKYANRKFELYSPRTFQRR